MVRANVDRFYDTNPNDAVVGTNAPTVARQVHARRSWTTQVNHTAVLGPQAAQRSAASHTCTAIRSRCGKPQALSTTYTRAGSVPFTIGESRSSDLFGHQMQIADTLSWSQGTSQTSGSAAA